VTVSVRDARVSEEDRLWIERVYRDYLDDLAPLNTGIFPVLGEVGHRENDQIRHRFADPNTFPLLIVQGPRPVGFAMVARLARLAGASSAPTSARERVPGHSGSASQPNPQYRMAEFFISREHRHLGIGRSAVELILNRFAGRWEIVEYLRNPGAVAFWRRVVSRYTRGQFQERVLNGEVHQLFMSGARAADIAR
jgi:predicted acetyltransferase